MSSPSKPAIARIAAASPARSSGGNSSTPGRQQEALEADDAGVVQRVELAGVAGHGAAPERDVDARAARRRPRAWSPSAATSTVGGMLLSGMSTIVVTPPAAAAAVAVAKPSHSVRPGSLTCTWLSTRPGSSDPVVGGRSTSRAAPGRRRLGDRRRCRPSRIDDHGRRARPSGVITRAARSAVVHRGDPGTPRDRASRSGTCRPTVRHACTDACGCHRDRGMSPRWSTSRLFDRLRRPTRPRAAAPVLRERRVARTRWSRAARTARCAPCSARSDAVLAELAWPDVDRGAGRASAHRRAGRRRRPRGGVVAAGAVRRGGRGRRRGRARCAAATSPTSSASARLPDLRHRPLGRRDAGRAARAAGQRRPAAERDVVRRELAAIVRLRLEQDRCD